MPEAVIVEAVRTPVGKGKPGGALSGVTPAKGGTLLPLGGPANQKLQPAQVTTFNGAQAELIGDGTKGDVESGQLPPGISVAAPRHQFFFLAGTLSKPGTYAFVLRFTGGGIPAGGDVIPFVWTITP